ncbi:alpha-N-arabinofuranosidase [Schleiferilactobacillus shenzhenensis]|uniref:arabinosylfuranosidase ArfA n=1 Tax=Schleiferilactobacillus shenzhenensis TaxID=1231337 RepID=UPI0003FB34D2|nr:alpha-N-arabinofuranosidase [Schleiferilactobacillus shenzhenensis]
MKSSITLDKYAPVGEIDERIYGSFIEHLGRAVYTGIYQPGHPSADENGFRQDVIDLINKLNVPIIRYPGGNFVSGFNWEDSVGPKDQRPRRLDLAWQTIESNQFGLHEFMQWLGKVHAKPMMAVNLGTRGIDAARNLIEYTNFPKGSYYSDMRRRNGAEQPFNIKTWCLGNEMDGPWQIGHKDAVAYGKLANETAHAMRIVDDSIETVACGSSGLTMPTFGSWEDTVLDLTYDNIDYLSLHRYYGNQDNDTPNFLAQSLDLDAFISGVTAICDAVKARKHSQKTINLSLDEWNVWYHSNNHDAHDEKWQEAPHKLEDIYNFEDALLVGSMLITMLHHADRLKMACLAQLVNVIAPIMTDENGGAWAQSIFYPFMQVSTLGKGTVLTPIVHSETYGTKEFDAVPFVDGVAVLNDAGDTVTVFAVNKSLDTAQDFTIAAGDFDFASVALSTQMAGYGLKETNEDGHMGITPNTTARLAEDGVHVTLAPASWNTFQIKVN